MGRVQFKGGTLLAPVPPALVTVGNMEEANVLTVAWTGIICSDPAMTYVSVRPSRHSHKMLQEGGDFVIHLPSAIQAKEVDYCGIFTGAKVNKFEKCGFTLLQSTHVGAPTIAQCPIALECRVTQVISLGSHDMFMAEILGVSAHEELLDEKGKLHMEWANLCAYAHGTYYSIGKELGKFGFSAAKRKGGHHSKKTGGKKRG